MQELGLNLQKISLNSDGTADTPEQGCKTEHELAFDGCSGVVICNDGCFERLIVLNIFQSDDDSFGRQTMSDCIVPRSPFSIFGFRTRAAERIASIGLDLSKRSHPFPRPSVFCETKLFASAAGKRLTARS
jgi:hypothetical protein